MKTILVVDDDETILLAISRFLGNLSIKPKVLTAENGVEAIDVLKAGKVDLVLTDLNMPVMDGFMLLAYMSANYPDIEAIVMTGLQSPEIHETLSFLGITYCMEKPFSIRDLKEKIMRHLVGKTGKPEPTCAVQPVNTMKSAFIRQVF